MRPQAFLLHRYRIKIERARITSHRDLKILSRYYQVSVNDLAQELAQKKLLESLLKFT
jgi:hypothetical protein